MTTSSPTTTTIQIKPTPGVLITNSLSGMMMNDYVELNYEEKEKEVDSEDDVNRESETLRFTQANPAKLELAESMTDEGELIVTFGQ